MAANNKCEPKVAYDIADGLWYAVSPVVDSNCGVQVRTQLVGTTEPNYSEYTCYTGISDFTPPDIDTVGYRVFLGNGKYFVSSDVGGGKMQWYGFHKEPAGAWCHICSFPPHFVHDVP